MSQREDRVFPQHARSRVSHHSLYVFPSLGLVAVDRTIGARGLSLAETTTFQPHGRVLEQSVARRTQFPFGPVVVLAVAKDHCCHGFTLTTEARGRDEGRSGL